MEEQSDASDGDATIAHVRSHALAERIRITQHAQQEMAEDDLRLEDLLYALRQPRLLENYPEHQRGACCLILGMTARDRPIHVVCTTSRSVLVIITVYEPKPPKWSSPTQRRQAE